MSTTLPQYPTQITLETLPQLLTAHRARFGGWTMIDPPTPPTDPPAPPDPPAPADPPAAPERPEGVSEDEWTALGDPGQRAILRERERTQAAERALAAARARPGPPKKTTPPAPPKTDPPAGDPDIASIIRDAVSEAVKPFQEKEEQREAATAVERIQSAVLTAAGDAFVDPTDALTGIDLTQVTDGSGGVDLAKVKSQLDDLLIRKPHLGKTPDGRRYAPPGSPAGAVASAAPLEQKVQATLTRMKQAAGIKAI